MHTPGPWQMHDEEYCPEEIYGNLDGPLEDGKIRGTRVCVLDEDIPEMFANAKLIAAAPELLAALKSWVEYFDRLDASSDPDDPMSQARNLYHAKRIEASRKALRKAT